VASIQKNLALEKYETLYNKLSAILAISNVFIIFSLEGTIFVKQKVATPIWL